MDHFAVYEHIRPDVRARKSAASKIAHANPETAAKKRAGMLASWERRRAAKAAQVATL